MSSHAISTLRKRSTQRFGGLALVLSAMLALWLAIGGQLALAQVIDPPPPANANPRSATTAEDTPVSIDTGIQADPRYQIVVVVPGPTHGSIVQGGTFPGNFTINYTPGANQTTPVSFSYQVCTLVGTPTQCGQSALVTVSITPVNDPPQAVPDTASVLFGQNILINVLSNDNGGSNESDIVSLVSVATPGNASIEGTAVVENGQVRYTAPTATCPVADRTVVFTYQAQDASGNQSTGQVTVTVKCPGVPGLRVSDPYDYNGHTFKLDVILDSADVNVAAVDFTLNYNACLTDVDLPTNNQVADDVTTALPPSSFLFQATDTNPPPAPGAVRVIAASTISPAAILAGPGASTTRTIATVQFRATATTPPGICTPSTLSFTFVDNAGNPITGFTSTAGTPTAGLGIPKTITLDAAKLNNKPTNLTLSNNKVNENSPFNTFIGEFATTDPDAGDTFIYGFYGPHFDSAGRFRIRPLAFNNDELAINAVGLASGVYSITVGTMDNFGAVYTRTFRIEVLDVNAPPVANDDGNPVAIPAAGPTTISVLANDTDNGDFPADPTCTNCSVVSVTNGARGIVVNQGTTVRYIPTNPSYVGTDVFSYVMTDNDAPNALTASAKVTVSVAAEVYPVGHPLAGQPVKLGDCNGSGAVEAGDLSATGLEIFDGDGNLWYDIYKGSRTTFSPRGCNSNQDTVLDAGDISCTARKIFNAAATCGAVVASGAGKATLEVASGLRGAAGSTVNVPVSLRNNGNAVDTAVFALAYDASKLSFNADDASAVSLSDGQLALVNAADGRVEIVVTGLSSADGAVATIRLSVKADASGDAAISLADSSLGSEGGSVAVDTAGGAIQIGGAGSVNFRSLLPIIRK